MHAITDDAALDTMWRTDLVVLYKHSPACWLSLRAMREMQRFVEQYPQVPVYVVNVLSHRPLSQQIAQRTGVRHESPQVIVLRAGAPVWSGSHMGVTAEAIARGTPAS